MDNLIKALTNVRTAIPLIAVSIGLSIWLVDVLIEKNLISDNYIIYGVLIFIAIIILAGFIITLIISNPKKNSLRNVGDRNKINQSGKGQNNISNQGDENEIIQN